MENIMVRRRDVSHKVIQQEMSNILTQCLFARTVSFTASRNCSTLGAGMHNRSAPVFIRSAFSCGRKRRIDPSSFLCARRPSSNPCGSLISILEHINILLKKDHGSSTDMQSSQT